VALGYYILCMNNKVAIAADHGGYILKAAIIEKFQDQYDFIDLGTNDADSVDYPDFAEKLASALKAGDAPRGILVCGTGIGISIAANRHGDIRAANCTDTTMARLTRQHNDANVLALGERTVGSALAFDIVETFLTTEFEGGRHQRRIDKMS